MAEGFTGALETFGISAVLGVGVGLPIASHGASTSFSGIMDFYYMFTNQNEKIGTFDPFKDVTKLALGEKVGETFTLGMDIVSIFI